ncbi:muts domain V-domain-containing protein [Mycena haematopus]|nr:muts domain V-domain-containing protein [Mycena haematopus]
MPASGTSSSSPARQGKISAFFPRPNKRSATIDLTSPSPESPSKKRKAEQWRFDPSSPERVATTDTATKPGLSKNKSKETFRDKFLSRNNTSTARAQAAADSESKLSDSDSDPAFDKLSALFSATTGSKTGKKSKATRKAVQELGPSGETYTPLENQVRRLKKDNPGVVLFVEVGYKYKFFGEDAQVAAKELGMVCFLDRNFLVASIPTHRRDIHLKKLLSQGYKVGIVQQVETAALKKAGENRNAPFERKLVHLYTAATYVDDLDSIDQLDKYAAPRLICLIEGKSAKSAATGADVCIGMVSVSPQVGDVVWDVFDDSAMRIELETRLVHSKPVELLIQRDGLSKSTEKLLKHFTDAPTASTKIRTEYFDHVMPFSEAFEYVSQFYANTNDPDSGGRPLAAITDFPKPVVVALGCTIRYLSAFDIAATLSQATFFTKFTRNSEMNLAANTLANLEVFQNETDYSTRGSLIWILDKTVTSFGARKLRAWVGKPLVSRGELELRIEAIEEIIESSSEKLVSLRQVLKGLPDLSKGLCRIQYKQCTPKELALLLSAFHKIGNAFADIHTPTDVDLKSTLLNNIILSLPPLKQAMQDLLGAINVERAKQGNMSLMWRDPSKYPLVEDNISALHQVEMELDQELAAIRKTLKMPSLQWSTGEGEDKYLIEVKKSENRFIPASYHPAVSKTSKVERYRPPEVAQKLQERARWQESLQIEAKKAFLDFLDEVAIHYAILRNAVNKLAEADCLLSLAQVALQDNYVKPQFSDDGAFEIVEGRHPMVEALRSDPFVPNSVSFSEDGRSKVITGPNMGGKSSCVRMIALIAIMAQVGSYVPAKFVKLDMLDSILTRMGAHDDLTRGRSTFMVEMTETSDILRAATSKSLVILDELGRGTSTFDGMAIAYAVLNELVTSTRCKTLFITHYPLVAAELEEKYPSAENLHVGYSTETRAIDGRRDVTFLYRLTSGIAPESFGVECARLAGLPESILSNATEKSSKMESAVAARAKRNTSLKALQLLKNLLQKPSSEEQVEMSVDELLSLLPQANLSS